jgi:tetratricopeptide (TPR) repeat protein
MGIYIRSIWLFLAGFAICGVALAEEGILVIHISNAEDEPVAGVVLSNKGDGTRSAPSDSAGVTRLDLPRGTRPSDWVHLQVLKGTEGNDNWILISPWDGRVAVPLFDNKPDRFVSVVVVRKFDKRLLATSKFITTITANVLNELSPKTSDETITDEQRRAVLVEQAKTYGLEPDAIDKAIRAWGEKSRDPYERGLAALYARNYPLASEQLSKSLEIRESELEKKKAEVADAAFFLGQSLFEQGKYHESANAYRKAAALRPDDATILNNLALSLTEAGSYAEAEPLHKRALTIREKTLGVDGPNVATSLNNLALLYNYQGKYTEAEPLHKRALAIYEKTLGVEHPKVAQSLSNLAVVYRNQGKYTEAEPLHKRALAIKEKTLGIEHPSVATSLNNLALLYDSQEKYAEAEPLYKRALAIYEKALRVEHPKAATTLSNLALLYDSQEKYAEAEPLYKRALAIYEKTLGVEHPDVAISLHNLGLLYVGQGKYTQAEPLYKRALAISEKVLGPNHPDVAQILEDYAVLLRKLNRETDATEMDKRAKAIHAKQK